MSVIKPDSVIPCTPNSWGASDNPRNSDRVYNDLIYIEGSNLSDPHPWHPIIPEDGSKTWIIYQYTNPISITDIKLSFYNPLPSMIVKIYKNVDVSMTTVSKNVGKTPTNYSTLKNYPSDANLIYTKEFTQGYINYSDVLSQTQTNISNIYIEFSYATFVYEIQFLYIYKEPIFPSFSVKLKTEKSELKLRKFKPENYCMFSPSIDNGNAPKLINSIMLIGNDIYFCLYDGPNMVKIIRFNKDGQSLDNIYIENLQDKTKLRETLLKPPTQSTLTFYPSNSTTSYYLYNYPYKGDTKTKTEWVNFLRQYRVTPDMIKRLYENGDEYILLNPNTITSVNIDTKLYYVNPLQTDRIFIYNDTNKLVNVTDYISREKLYELTLIKNNDTIISKLVPNIPSGYGSVGNIPYTNCDAQNKSGCVPFIKGYSWDKVPNKQAQDDNICVAIGDTMISGQGRQNILLAGSVINNRCRVWGRDSYSYYLYDREDFRYLNKLTDSGLQWVNKDNGSVSQKRVRYQYDDTSFGKKENGDTLTNFSTICRTEGEIGSIFNIADGDGSPYQVCRIAKLRSGYLTENSSFDVLYSTDVAPTRVYTQPQNCPLDCNSTDIQNKIVDYYNNQSSFKGKYRMTILNTNKVDDNTCDVHYRYTPISAGTTGEDFRRVIFDTCNTRLSNFEKTLSGTTLRQIDFPNKISLRTNEGKFCSDTDNGIVCNSSTDGQNETFQVEKILQDKIAIKGRRNLYCSDYSSVVDCFSPYKDSWETFNYENLGNNQVSIKSPKTNNYCAYKTDSKSLVCDQPTSSRTDQSKFTYTAK